MRQDADRPCLDRFLVRWLRWPFGIRVKASASRCSILLSIITCISILVGTIYACVHLVQVHEEQNKNPVITHQRQLYDHPGMFQTMYDVDVRLVGWAWEIHDMHVNDSVEVTATSGCWDPFTLKYTSVRDIGVDVKQSYPSKQTPGHNLCANDDPNVAECIWSVKARGSEAPIPDCHSNTSRSPYAAIEVTVVWNITYEFIVNWSRIVLHKFNKKWADRLDALIEEMDQDFLCGVMSESFTASTRKIGRLMYAGNSRSCISSSRNAEKCHATVFEFGNANVALASVSQYVSIDNHKSTQFELLGPIGQGMSSIPCRRTLQGGLLYPTVLVVALNPSVSIESEQNAMLLPVLLSAIAGIIAFAFALFKKTFRTELTEGSPASHVSYLEIILRCDCFRSYDIQDESKAAESLIGTSTQNS